MKIPDTNNSPKYCHIVRKNSTVVISRTRLTTGSELPLTQTEKLINELYQNQRDK